MIEHEVVPMHTYTPEWPADLAGHEPVNVAKFTYRSAHDVAKCAAQEPLTTWYTWPEVWHLDSRGRWRCCSKGSSFDSVHRFAEDPERMLDCRLDEPRRGCPNNWVVLEPRHEGRRHYEVTEADAEAFVRLRGGLAGLGVHLLDVVVFDQGFHWWSLHELTSGATEWTFVP